MTAPARRVIYRSPNARLARVALGLVLTAVTVWLVLPVLAVDHGPPPPLALVVGTNAVDLGPHESLLKGTALSVLDVKVHAKGCSNPVLIEGTLWRSTDTWYAEKRSRFSAPPDQAIVTVAGAPVISITVGLDSFSPYAYEGLQHVSGTARVASLNGKPVVIHDRILALIRSRDATSAVLNAPQWPRAATPLWFRVWANLMRPAGFQSCYLALPQLFPYQSSYEGQRSASDRAQIALLRIAEHIRPPVRRAVSTPGGVGDEAEALGAALVTASVDGKRVTGNSIGLSGTETVSGGVRYLCHAFIRHKLPLSNLDARISPEFNEGENPDCSGVPLFESSDVLSDTTRRLFAAGIVGALAATLIIEALFLGETESGAKRKRWRRAH